MANGSVRAERSAERRSDITAAATRLFQRNGYVAVSVDEIGQAVGVTGPAMYRHFSSKQELLAEVILSFLDDIARRRERLAQPASEPPRAVAWAAAVDASLHDPGSLVVLLRLLGHLDAHNLQRAAEAHDKVFGPCEGSLVTVGADSAHLKVRAAAGVLLGTMLPRSTARLPRADFVRRAADAVLDYPVSDPVPGQKAPAAATGAGALSHASRREAILAAATQLFRERSYHGVSLRDIGDQVGITASAIRRHFDSKDDLLSALFNRGGEQVAAAIDGVLRESSDPGQAVAAMLGSYARLAVESRDLNYIYLTEMHSLPEEQRLERRRMQRIHVDELSSLLNRQTPELSKGQSWMRASAAYSLINEVVLNDQLVMRPNLASELAELALAVTRVGPRPRVAASPHSR